MITVKYFGAIAAQANVAEEMVLFAEQSLVDLIQAVTTKYNFDTVSYSVAVNHELIQDVAKFDLQSNDVVALLPPFAGG